MYRKYTIVMILALALSGCATAPRPKPKASQAPTAAKKAAQPVDLTKTRPNESGKVLILEYHDIGKTEERWARQYDNFRADLQRLYKLGYQPVSVRDYVTNNINTTAGKSPVVFTFDDGTAGQFTFIKENGHLIVDPNCAVGIMEAFHRKHQDWPMEATFYVYYLLPFRQKDSIAEKMRRILDDGMDIGNHTYTHTRLDKESDEGAAREMALNVKAARQYAPDAIVDSIALPYGKGPNNKAVLVSGEFGGIKYHNIAALLVGAEPAPSPVSPKFNPYRLPRVQAIQSELDLWLKYLERHPEERYVSDGDPNTVTVPKSLADKVDQAKLRGKVLRTY